jgi:cell division protein FtsQ
MASYTRTVSRRNDAAEPDLRFKARAKSVRRRRWLPYLWAVLIGCLAGATLYVLLTSSLLSVHSVRITGAGAGLTSEVQQAAGIPKNASMVKLNIHAIEQRVEQVPQVASAEVVRDWPHTIRIVVTPRQVTAAVKTSDGYALYDSDGVNFGSVATAPSGVPVVKVGSSDAGDSVTAAVTAFAALPSAMRAAVTTISATTPDNVVFVLASGQRVIWGTATDNAHKALVLRALMTQHAKTYDVSAPDVPTTSGS